MSRTASLWPAGIVTTARTFSRLTSVPLASSMRAMTTSSSGWRRIVSSTACSMSDSPSTLQRMARHQLIGMHPAGQGLDALEPCLDERKLAPAYAELVRPVQVAAQREIGDGRLPSGDEGAHLEVLVENDERGLDARAQELGHRRLSGFLEVNEETQRGDVAGELVVVPEDPAQNFASLVFVLPAEFFEYRDQIIEDHPGLRKAPVAVLEH